MSRWLFCLQTWPEPAVSVEGAGKPAEKMFLTFTWSYVLNCDYLNLCAIVCDI